jgi:predicted RNase H-like HicB family nuclease
MLFPVVVHKDEKSDYSVTIPDMPGCFTAGESLDEAICNIQEAAECHYMDESELPTASPLERFINDPDYSGGTWVMINIDLAKLRVKAKRVNITIPENLLSEIDHYAAQYHLSRSGLLTQAAGEYIHHRKAA